LKYFNLIWFTDFQALYRINLILFQKVQYVTLKVVHIITLEKTDLI